jgi:uncharacterized protein YegP (UPF0339 family)
MYRFEIRTSSNGQYYCVLVASNGQDIVWSESYTSKQNAINAAHLVKQHAASAPIYD